MDVKTSFAWIQTMTALYIVTLVVVLVAIGFGLRVLVRSDIVTAKNALRLIGFISQVVGGLLGSVAVLIVLVILWPEAASWIVNTYLSKTGIWQLEFQQYITAQLADSRIATAVGYTLKGFQFGGVALGYFFGVISKTLFAWVMGKAYHTKLHLASIGRGSKAGV